MGVGWYEILLTWNRGRFTPPSSKNWTFPFLGIFLISRLCYDRKLYHFWIQFLFPSGQPSGLDYFCPDME
jgi:hypothetical protein